MGPNEKLINLWEKDQEEAPVQLREQKKPCTCLYLYLIRKKEAVNSDIKRA
jgi:hypothetical protein